MKNLKALRIKKGLTMKQLGTEIGVSESTISCYESGKRQPDYDTLMKLANTFGVSTDYLLGRIDYNTEFSQIEFIKTIKIPVLGRIPAGEPIDAIEDILGYIEIASDRTNGGKEFFSLKIKGSSMSPEYQDGDIVIFEKVDTCETGEDCAVLINGYDATFKRIERKENGVMLKPLNPTYETLFFTNEEIINKPVRIIGVARELRRAK